jgi:surface antigen
MGLLTRERTATLGNYKKFAFSLASFMLILLADGFIATVIISALRPVPVRAEVSPYLATESGSCVWLAINQARTGITLPASCRVDAAAPPVQAVVSTAASVNTYDFGNCTYWVAERRAQIGQPIPDTWGDAEAWADQAAADGYSVDHTPAYGAIMQTAAGVGHVAFVESVDSDGTWHISEMNAIGFDEVDYKALPASIVANFYFIH